MQQLLAASCLAHSIAATQQLIRAVLQGSGRDVEVWVKDICLVGRYFSAPSSMHYKRQAGRGRK